MGKTKINNDKLTELFKAGQSANEIAKYFNVNPHSVRAKLDLLDLKRIVSRDERSKNRKAKSTKKKVSNVYWTQEVQEKLLIDFNNEPAINKRNKIYRQLRPALTIMLESVLRRFFKNFLSGYDTKKQQDLILDCESFLITDVFSKFNPETSRAYAYVGTCIKHFYFDHFMSKKKVYPHISINDFQNDDTYDRETDNHFDIPDNSVSALEHFENVDYLRSKAKDHVTKLLNKTQQIKFRQKEVLLAVLDLLNQTNWNRHYSTYFLLSRTKMSVLNLYRVLQDLGMNILINTNNNLEFYQKIIDDYKVKYGAHKDFVKIALDDLTVTGKPYKYKIQNKANEQRKRKEAREAKRKAEKNNEQITSKINSVAG